MEAGELLRESAFDRLALQLQRYPAGGDGPWRHRQPDLARRRTGGEMRGRSRANFVAPHFLTRERLGSGWILCRYSGESRRSGGPLCQGAAHIEMTDSRLAHAL